MFAMHRDQQRLGARTIKEAGTVDNAPAEFIASTICAMFGPTK